MNEKCTSNSAVTTANCPLLTLPQLRFNVGSKGLLCGTVMLINPCNENSLVFEANPQESWNAWKCCHIRKLGIYLANRCVIPGGLVGCLTLTNLMVA